MHVFILKKVSDVHISVRLTLCTSDTIPSWEQWDFYCIPVESIDKQQPVAVYGRSHTAFSANKIPTGAQSLATDEIFASMGQKNQIYEKNTETTA